MGRRSFCRTAALGATATLLGSTVNTGRNEAATITPEKPNILYILADQWRAQAVGYSGNTDVRTPNIDRLAAESISLTNAVSGCPVCSPYRASFITGRYPLTHGVFVNDVYLNTDAVSIAQAYNAAGYDTGIIGKWHLDGHGSRSSFIPRERRQGFKFWKTLECTHDYNNSYYYSNEDKKLTWEGYDAIAQTREAQKYIRGHADGSPFFLYLPWGPPHAPYHTAPPEYRKLYENTAIALRPNVPKEREAQARKDIAGYYAHIAALDGCVGKLVETLREAGLAENTILVFTADHGDMLYSQNQRKKQRPWEESVRIPFLIRYPAEFGAAGRGIDMPFNSPDIMPTLLGLSDIEIPRTVEGEDFSDVLRGVREPDNEAALIMCPQPFGQFLRKEGGREYRGVRTRRYTYTRDMNGPWLLYDNWRDPFQMENLVNRAEYRDLRSHLEKLLKQKLEVTNDDFRPGMEYINKWGYTVDDTGTVPYTW